MDKTVAFSVTVSAAVSSAVVSAITEIFFTITTVVMVTYAVEATAGVTIVAVVVAVTGVVTSDAAEGLAVVEVVALEVPACAALGSVMLGVRLITGAVLSAAGKGVTAHAGVLPAWQLGVAAFLTGLVLTAGGIFGVVLAVAQLAAAGGAITVVAFVARYVTFAAAQSDMLQIIVVLKHA